VEESGKLIHTHTHSRVILTTSEAFRSEILRGKKDRFRFIMLGGFCQSLQN
jgi:hypothetical protein